MVAGNVDGIDLQKYRSVITDLYAKHNPSKVADVDALIDKYAGQPHVLYNAICNKYDIEPDVELATLPEPSSPASGVTASRWGQGLWSGLQNLQGAAQGLREQVENTFDEAIRSEGNEPRLEAASDESSGGSCRAGGTYEPQMSADSTNPPSPSRADENCEHEASIETYRQRIAEIYSAHNPDKLADVDNLLDKYRSSPHSLYKAVCQKYNLDVDPSLLPKAARITSEVSLAVDATSAVEIAAAAKDAARVKASKAAEGLSVWGKGLWSGGLTTLHNLQTTAEGLQKQVEQTFDEAMRSEEDLTIEQMARGFRGQPLDGSSAVDLFEGPANVGPAKKKSNESSSATISVSASPSADGPKDIDALDAWPASASEVAQEIPTHSWSNIREPDFHAETWNTNDICTPPLSSETLQRASAISTLITEITETCHVREEDVVGDDDGNSSAKPASPTACGSTDETWGLNACSALFSKSGPTDVLKPDFEIDAQSVCDERQAHFADNIPHSSATVGSCPDEVVGSCPDEDHAATASADGGSPTAAGLIDADADVWDFDVCANMFAPRLVDVRTPGFEDAGGTCDARDIAHQNMAWSTSGVLAAAGGEVEISVASVKTATSSVAGLTDVDACCLNAPDSLPPSASDKLNTRTPDFEDSEKNACDEAGTTATVTESAPTIDGPMNPDEWGLDARSALPTCISGLPRVTKCSVEDAKDFCPGQVASVADGTISRSSSDICTLNLDNSAVGNAGAVSATGSGVIDTEAWDLDACISLSAPTMELGQESGYLCDESVPTVDDENISPSSSRVCAPCLGESAVAAANFAVASIAEVCGPDLDETRVAVTSEPPPPVHVTETYGDEAVNTRNRELHDYREAIVATYTEHDPSELSDVDGLLARNVESPQVLYEAICTKYGVTPTSNVAKCAASQIPAADTRGDVDVVSAVRSLAPEAEEYARDPLGHSLATSETVDQRRKTDSCNNLPPEVEECVEDFLAHALVTSETVDQQGNADSGSNVSSRIASKEVSEEPSSGDSQDVVVLGQSVRGVYACPCRDAIITIYTEHNPSKIADVDELLATYDNHVLYEAICKKYGVALNPDLLRDSFSSSPQLPSRNVSLTDFRTGHSSARISQDAEPNELNSPTGTHSSSRPSVRKSSKEVVASETDADLDLEEEEEPACTARVDAVATFETEGSGASAAEDGAPQTHSSDQDEPRQVSTATPREDVGRTMQQTLCTEGHAEVDVGSFAGKAEHSLATDIDPRMHDQQAGDLSADIDPCRRGERAYRDAIVAIYSEHNPDKVGDVDGLLVKYGNAPNVLYEAICKKYGVVPDRGLLSDCDAVEEEPGDQGTIADKFAPITEQVRAENASAPAMASWGGGFFRSGVQALQTLHGAAEGLREQVEKTFDEAIRSEEELSTSQVVQNIRGAVEKSVERQQVAAAALDFPQVPAGMTTVPPRPVSPEVSVQNDGENGLDVELPTENAQPCDKNHMEHVHAQLQMKVQQQALLHAQLHEQLDAANADRERLKRELTTWRSKHNTLIEEGKTMSRRVLAVEERMKAAVAETRRADGQASDLERSKEALSLNLSRMTQKAEKAESLAIEQRNECKKLAGELDRTRKQLVGEKQHLQAEQLARDRKSKEQTDRDQRLEDKLHAVSHERDELLATNSALTSDLHRALAAADLAERQTQRQTVDAEQANDQQQRRLEELELEFASQTLPFQRRIADLESQLAEFERKRGEREAELVKQLAAQRTSLKDERQEMKRREEQQERRETMMREEAANVQKKLAEVESAERQFRELRAAPEAASTAKESADAEAKLQASRRRSAEQRAEDMAGRVQELERKISSMQVKEVAAATASMVRANSQHGPYFPVSTPPLVAATDSDSATGADGEIRRLKLHIETLTRQRDALTAETSRLQNRADSLQMGPAALANSQKAAILEQRFEAALQAIGKLQEDLEVVQEERDSYRRHCQELSQLAGGTVRP